MNNDDIWAGGSLKKSGDPVNYPPPLGGELLIFASTELLVHRSNKLLNE